MQEVWAHWVVHPVCSGIVPVIDLGKRISANGRNPTLRTGNRPTQAACHNYLASRDIESDDVVQIDRCVEAIGGNPVGSLSMERLVYIVAGSTGGRQCRYTEADAHKYAATSSMPHPLFAGRH